MIRSVDFVEWQPFGVAEVVAARCVAAGPVLDRLAMRILSMLSMC